jgi:hypothetical protein
MVVSFLQSSNGEVVGSDPPPGRIIAHQSTLLWNSSYCMAQFHCGESGAQSPVGAAPCRPHAVKTVNCSYSQLLPVCFAQRHLCVPDGCKPIIEVATLFSRYKKPSHQHASGMKFRRTGLLLPAPRQPSISKSMSGLTERPSRSLLGTESAKKANLSEI